MSQLLVLPWVVLGLFLASHPIRQPLSDMLHICKSWVSVRTDVRARLNQRFKSLLTEGVVWFSSSGLPHQLRFRSVPADQVGPELRRQLVGVNKVGGEFPFALHGDRSSEREVVSNDLDNLGRFLCHLRAQSNNKNIFWVNPTTFCLLLLFQKELQYAEVEAFYFEPHGFPSKSFL